MSRGNPNFIASGWGEPTKPVKLPLRLAERIQELRDDGLNCDDFLELLDADSDTDVEAACEILQDALTFKANAGGAIKNQIRQALEMLGFDTDA